VEVFSLPSFQVEKGQFRSAVATSTAIAKKYV
jgi:hypothetical protein